MENNILILEESNIPQLARLNLPMYSQILVTISQQDGKISILTAKALLAVQLQHQLNIQLLVNTAHSPDMNIFWAWLLGKLTATSPDAQITILSNCSQKHQPLVEICTEYNQSVRLLQVMDDTKNSVQMMSEQEKKAIATTTNPEPSAEVFADIHSIEPTEKRSVIAEMIREKEDRKHKNEQMINALMKKVSESYKIVESKPASSLMKEQVIAPNQQILID